MIKTLLPEAEGNLRYYRANLHCHSTCSDGRKTPEQLKAFYQAKGYSVIAFTDHSNMYTHNDLTDDTFLALNGYEVGVDEREVEPGRNYNKTCHICLIAPNPEIEGNIDFRFPGGLVPYSSEYVSLLMKQAKDKGYYVTYNHPTWSVESYPDYMSYHGMDAMEIVNFGCVVVGFDDDNGHCYDDMLRGGERIACIATDDNHNQYPDESLYCDSFGGYTMIASESLDYDSIFSALKAGRFYASSGTSQHDGPEILSLSVDTEKRTVTVRTSPVRSIQMMTDGRYCQIHHRDPDKPATDEATFRYDDQKWFRIVATDDTGAKAYSNAYFPETF